TKSPLELSSLSLHDALPILLNALQLGSIYALIALGYSMVYGILTMINFAHGDVFMIGAFCCLLAATALGLPFAPTLLLTMAGTRSEEHTSELQSRENLVCRL